jgi:hypothetical protein
MDSRCIFVAYGVILKHLEVDKITRRSFSKKTNIFLKRAPFTRGADGLFGRTEGRGALFLTGVENTACVVEGYMIPVCIGYQENIHFAH